MAGVLFVIVGPSGVGKDSLIAHAKGHCEAHHAGAFVFVRRVVTRGQNAFEDHDSLSLEAFEKARARGAFCLNWQAHGLSYGIPKSLLEAVHMGKHSILNCSRTIIPELCQIFANVRVIYVDAQRAVLAARLAARGREEHIEGRLNAAQSLAATTARDITIDNSHAFVDAAKALSDYIDATLAVLYAKSAPQGLSR